MSTMPTRTWAVPKTGKYAGMSEQQAELEFLRARVESTEALTDALTARLHNATFLVRNLTASRDRWQRKAKEYKAQFDTNRTWMMVGF